MIFEKSIQLLRRRAFPSSVDQIPQFRNLVGSYFARGKAEGEGFQFDPNLVDLFGVLVCESGHLRPRKRRALNKALMLEFDQCLANQALADSKLLRQFTLDNLI